VVKTKVYISCFIAISIGTANISSIYIKSTEFYRNLFNFIGENLIFFIVPTINTISFEGNKKFSMGRNIESFLIINPFSGYIITT